MTRISLLIVFAALICSSTTEAQQPPMPLWAAGQVPGEADVKLPAETVADKNNDGITRTSNVSVPTITLYPAPVDHNTGTAVIVAPGGGYGILASKHEGSDVCEFLNTIGVNAILLKYRVPRRQGLAKHHAPLQDAQRAISLVRYHAKDWNIDPDRVGILGFSAGGHLAVMALTSDGTRTFKIDHDLDEASCVPDFGILIYPAYLISEEDRDELSAEIKVTQKTPPAFITVAHGDKKYVEGSARFYIEMLRNNRQCELHIYGHGGHGFGMKDIPEKVSEWPQRLADWMGAMGYLK
jgi:acetyl esterase/lipase